ncbi:hypothetical protein F511_43816 [Dorcoceras hygrometricum]|uniref:Uncharacterized protein n=1 Tax=Dorcoceras hygrometricum TaxID=472368 RepID=A0A2Z7CW42_9LAMI|nr:hypothetical protein F511_43816 [Dorcoceras hygrometricum]
MGFDGAEQVGFTYCRAEPPPPPAAAVAVAVAAASSPEFVPAKFDEENPSAQISSALLVQYDEGT